MVYRQSVPGLRIIILVIGLFLAPAVSLAQLFSYSTIPRPRGVDYRVLSTHHFDIIFEEGYLEEANAAIQVLNRHLSQTQTLLGHEHILHIPVVLNGFNDRSNGFVTPLPFKQEIEIANIKSRSLSPRHASWFHTVLPHELVHAVQADLRKGFGIGSLVRPFAPDIARTFNFFIPPGISEGLAVYYESRHKPGAGRLNHSFFKMRFRAAMMSDKPWSMAQLLEKPAYSWPLDRFYLGGAHLVDYLAKKDSLDFFHRSSSLTYRLPFLGFGVGLWYGARQWPAKVYKAFNADIREKETARLEEIGELSKPTVIASKKGLTHRNPKWLNNDELVVYARGYNLRAGFYIYNIRDGSRRLLRTTQPTDDQVYSISNDGRKLYYAHYEIDPFISIKQIADLYEIDLESGSQRRLTRDKRLLAPVQTVSGDLWALQNHGQGNRLVQVDSTGEINLQTDFEDVRFQEVVVSPDGSRLITVMNVGGEQGIFEIELVGEKVELQQLTQFEEGSAYDVSFSDGGRHLYLTADPEGISNIYRLDFATNEILQITNARFGALEPAMSPDGNTLAYIDYQHEKFDLVMLEREGFAGKRIPSHVVKQNELLLLSPNEETPEEIRAGSIVDTSHIALSKYKMLRELKPRIALPIIKLKDDRINFGKKIGYGAGVKLQGTDPLQKVAYDVSLYGQSDNIWGQASIQAAGHVVQPYLTAFNSLSTIGAILVDGSETQQVRTARQRRGVAIGLQMPVVFHRNVYQSGASLTLQGGLEDVRLYAEDGLPFMRKYTLDPSMALFYRIQSNSRDLVPNHGLVLSINSTVDLKRDEENGDRALIGRLTGYLPFLRRANIGLRVYGAWLSQNRGAIYNLDNFLPRGYEDEIFLNKGNHFVLGFEYVQPLWYVDNGFLVLPLYIKALYAFGFAEGLVNPKNAQLGGGADLSESAFSSGMGLGVKFRLLYHFNFDVRFTAAYRHVDNAWDFSWR